MIRRLGEGACLSISATTRPKSDQEEQGRDYYFVSRAEFDQMIRRGELLEWTEYLGNCYGTPRESVEQALEAGRSVVLEIEIEGAKQLAKTAKDAIMIFLTPPDDAELRRRLETRSREGPEQIEKRFANAIREIEQAREAGIYDHWIVNDDIDQALERILNIIQYS